jgi:hypothetical protein
MLTDFYFKKKKCGNCSFNSWMSDLDFVVCLIQKYNTLMKYKCVLYLQCSHLSVAIATRSDPASHNRLDLMQSLVPTHYVCNGYICLSLFLSSVPVYFSWKWGHQCSMDTVFIFVLFEGFHYLDWQMATVNCMNVPTYSQV